ncbi:MAG TPA: ScyD/ScyE family protein [Thermomicrobiales bacterium]|nr:ScyD/ScyE family protein [Thermomicrobiales bacterium]
MPHRSSRPGFRALLILMLAATMVPASIGAQGTSSSSNQGITLAASGLENPRGFDWGSDDTLYVALAGTGGERKGVLPDGADSQYTGGLSAGVVWIDEGCGATYQDNLPSTRDTAGTLQGASSVTVLDGRPYVLIDGGGAVYGNPDTPSGIYRIDGDGSARLIADIGAWVAANPSTQSLSDRDPAGGLTAMTDDEESFWIVEQSYGQVLRVTPDGEITRIADISADDEAPSAIAIAPDGGVYVGFQTYPPFVDGAARVVHIAQSGEVTDVWSGLTAISGLAVDPSGTLYALELGRDGSTDAPFVAAGTGKVVRQNGPDAAVDVAIGLDYPDAMAFGPDGGLYVTIPGTAGVGATGGVIRINTQQGQTMTMSESLFAKSTCVVSTPMPSVVASPVVNDSTPVPASPEAGTPAPADSAGNKISMEIVNFTFTPGDATIAVGTTVTWTNNDVIQHTVTAKDGSFDSGNLAPGESFTFTFTQAGTFAYVCQYHPNMAATIVVE